MKALSVVAFALAAASLVGACSVRTETVERPVPARTTVATTTPGTVVYADGTTAPASTTVVVPAR